MTREAETQSAKRKGKPCQLFSVRGMLDGLVNGNDDGELKRGGTNGRMGGRMWMEGVIVKDMGKR